METKKYTQKEATGSLFKNERKQAEKQPDYTGTGNFGGYDFQISAWLKKDKNDKTYMSIKFSEPYVKGGAKPASQDNDSIPF